MPKIKLSIYEILKFDVEVDTDKINMNDYHKKSTIDSIIRTEAHKAKLRLRNTDSKIIYTETFKEDSPSKMVEIHRKI